MTTLTRKLARDLWRIRAQGVAIAAVVAAGLSVATLEVVNLETLSRSQVRFYDEYRFADVFVSLKRAPLGTARRLAEIEGVADVEARVSAMAMLDAPDVPEPVSVRLIGIPLARHPRLNDVAVSSGRYLAAPDEVLVSEPFARAHRLAPGDSITAILNQQLRHLRVAGIALSPEVVYAIRPGSMFPDDRRFGVLWMDERALAAAFNLDGAFNDASLRLARGAMLPDVIRRVDTILGPYGGLGAYARKDQQSHWMLESELSELRTTGLLLPLVFSLVAAFLLHIVISRLVATQREQIGVLRAFGYSRLQIAWHYAQLVLTITAGGVAAGMPLGLALGWWLSDIYREFFHFPDLIFTVPWPAVVMGALIAAAVAVGGSSLAVHAVTRIEPAEALRPPAPAVFHATVLERLGLYRHLVPWLRIVVRNLERRPVRAGLAITAIALAASIMVLGRLGDSLRFIMDVEFSHAQRQSGTLVFVDPRPPRALHELARMPGVLAIEPFRSVPVRYVHGEITRRGAITGIEAAPLLARPLDASLHPVLVPPDGLVVSEKLAELLHVSPGDSLTVEALEGARPVRTALVAGTFRDYLGTGAYMERTALNRLMREGTLISGAHLLLDTAQEPLTFQQVKQTPGIAGLTVMRTVRQSFEETMQRSLLIGLAFLVGLAGVIAFGVVFNTARITLAERAWELATLRVLGFTRREVGGIVLAEIAILVVLAVPAGLWAGYELIVAVTHAYDTEMYRLPPVVETRSYVFAAALVAVATAISSVIVWRIAARLDLLSVLKARE
jgi:putative ABC transport system permease protein